MVKVCNPCTIIALVLFIAKLFSPYCQDMSWWWPFGILGGWLLAAATWEHVQKCKAQRFLRQMQAWKEGRGKRPL